MIGMTQSGGGNSHAGKRRKNCRNRVFEKVTGEGMQKAKAESPALGTQSLSATGWLVPPKIHVHLEPQNVTLFADVIS